jgi:hypothetical protein
MKTTAGIGRPGIPLTMAGPTRGRMTSPGGQPAAAATVTAASAAALRLPTAWAVTVSLPTGYSQVPIQPTAAMMAAGTAAGPGTAG